jgi:drug/metabolite transporter (DMT)-like permease
MLAILLSIMVASWPFNFIFGKQALQHMQPMMVASFRIVLAAIIMLPVYALFRWRQSFSSHLPSPARFHRGDFGTFALLGLLGMVMNQGCFVIGLSYTSVSHSALIVGMAPITILVLAWLQGLELPTIRKVAGMAVAFGGVTVLATEKGLHSHSSTLIGDVITFCGSIGFSLYTVFAKKLAWKFDTFSMNMFNYVFGGIVFLPMGVYECLAVTRAHAWGGITWKAWVGLAYMSVFGSVVAFLIYFWALRYMAASRLGALSYIHPIAATLLGILLLGEKITQSVAAGGALILAGMYLIQSGRERVARVYSREACVSPPE